MLHLLFEDYEVTEHSDCLVHSNEYFNYHYDYHWMNDPFVREIVGTVEESEVIQDKYLLDSLGRPMKPEELSVPTKVLILLYELDNVRIWGDDLGGESYWKVVLELAKKKDLYITRSSVPSFPKGFEVFVENTQAIVTDVWELYRICHDLFDEDEPDESEDAMDYEDSMRFRAMFYHEPDVRGYHRMRERRMRRLLAPYYERKNRLRKKKSLAGGHREVSNKYRGLSG